MVLATSFGNLFLTIHIVRYVMSGAWSLIISCFIICHILWQHWKKIYGDTRSWIISFNGFTFFSQISSVNSSIQKEKQQRKAYNILGPTTNACCHDKRPQEHTHQETPSCGRLNSPEFDADTYLTLEVSKITLHKLLLGPLKSSLRK